MSTCIVINYVIIRDVKPKTKGPIVSGDAKSNIELDETAIAAGTNA